jgi:hypothetical protein
VPANWFRGESVAIWGCVRPDRSGDKFEVISLFSCSGTVTAMVMLGEFLAGHLPVAVGMAACFAMGGDVVRSDVVEE